MLLAQASTAGNDTITGFNVNDTLTGGLGNDTLNGVAGNDTYAYNRGDGNDTITETTNNGNTDRLVLHGIATSAVSLARNGNDVTLVIAPSSAGATDGGSVLLKNNLDDWFDQGVEQIAFDDGTVWTRGTLRTMLLAQAPSSGNDTIVGFNTDDTLSGGPGNDFLQGAGGNDTYLFNLGDGQDTIFDNGGGTDTIQFGPGIKPGDLLVTQAVGGNDLVVSLVGTADQIKIQGGITGGSANAIEQVRFDDGTTVSIANPSSWLKVGTFGADTLTGSDTTNDYLYGVVGNDVLNGGAGNDVLDGGLGSNQLNGGAGTDTASYATSNNGVNVNLATGMTTQMTQAISGQYVRLYLIPADWLSLAEVQVFSGGVNVARSGTASQISTGFGGTADKAIDGSTNGFAATSPVVTSTGTNGAFNWWQVDLHATYNIDQIALFNRTDGGLGARLHDFDVVVFNQAPGANDSFQTVESSPGATVLHVMGQIGDNSVIFGGNGVDTLTGIENVFGSNFADNITGDSGQNRLEGGNGNDTLDGGAGADTMIGGAGNDTYIVDNAGDVVTETANQGTDTVRTSLAAYTLASNVENLTGTAAAQALTGNSLANTLTAGGADDTLAGGGGYDTYKVGAGMGHAVVNNLAADGVTTARGELDFGAGITDQQLWFMQNGNDLQIDLMGTTDQVTLSNWFGGNARAQTQSFDTADGLKVDTQVAQLVSAMATYAAANPGFNPTTATQMPADATLQGAVAAAWHP
jgi:Ca2+-binding RTX toxin-like protein